MNNTLFIRLPMYVCVRACVRACMRVCVHACMCLMLTCIVSSALPNLLDSDEEVMTTKFEMSKME